MLVVAFVIQRLIQRDAVELQDVEHRQARVRRAFENAQRAAAQLFGQFCRHVIEIDCSRDDGCVGCLNRTPDRWVDQHVRALASAPEHGEEAVSLALFGTRGESYLIGVTKIMRQLGGIGIAAARLHLEAAQHDLLEPGRNVRIELSRRHRIAPQALLQAPQLLRIAKGAHARCKEIHQAAERKEIAARVTADAHHLLRRHIGRRAIWQPELLLQKVGEVAVVGEAVVDQHRFARRAEQDVGGLHVEMHHALVVH